MDPSWRIKNQHGKGPGRLLLGFSRRVSPVHHLGLVASLRRFGWELPARGAQAALAFAALFVALIIAVLAIRSQSIVPDTELFLTYLDSPVQPVRSEQRQDATIAPALTLTSERTPMKTLTPAPVPIPSPGRISRVRTSPRAAASPQIDALDEMFLPEASTEDTESSRIIAQRPVPERSNDTVPALPAVAAVGPRAARTLVRPGKGSGRAAPPMPALSASAAIQPADPALDIERRTGLAKTASALASVRTRVHTGTPQGVPLGSLASCVSRDREETLKREVIARVPDPTRCESSGGVYRFVETKNLNAFLMWIERAGEREAGDRCTELSLALECLSQRVGMKETEKS